jgi:hemoglobin-like flavoprotein
MTPDDISLIRTDVALLDADAFSQDFYATLFELQPNTRPMFPDSMDAQRKKLMSELTVMIQLGTTEGAGNLDDFVSRAHRLGNGHHNYGVTGEHYTMVGIALVEALRRAISTWDDEHEHAWQTLYATVAATMREGAATAAQSVSS